MRVDAPTDRWSGHLAVRRPRSGARSLYSLIVRFLGVLVCTLAVAACTGSKSDLTIAESDDVTIRDEAPAEVSTTVAKDDLPEPSTTTEVIGVPSIADAEVLAFASVFTEDDLPEEWTECCPPLFGTPGELAGNTLCGVPAPLPTSLARFQRVFAFRQARDGSMLGRLTVSATVNADEASARSNLDAVGTPEYVGCTTESAVDSIRELYGDLGARGSATYEHVELPVGEQGSIGRMVAEVYPGGEFIESHSDLVRFRSGAVTYRMLFEMVRDHRLDEATIGEFARNLLDEVDDEG